MAERALESGVVPRRRALFGLLDAEGWAWASAKALFWFTVIIVVLAYIPDRVLYATIQPTIEVGVRAQALAPATLPDLTFVSLCPEENKGICAPPKGGILPWEPAPDQLNLPAPRVDAAAVQAGLLTMVIGGSDGTAATDTVFGTEIGADGNFQPWRTLTPLPAPRTEAAAVFLSGTLYLVGGRDASGKPVDTVLAGKPDPATGEIREWAESDALKLPAPRAAAAAAVTGDGLILVGGSDAQGPVSSVWKATTDARTGALKAWTEQTGLPEERTGATAVLSGTGLLVFGGATATGPAASVLRGEIGTEGDALGSVVAWRFDAKGRADLPAARAGSIGFAAGGGLYEVGGAAGHGELHWTVPTAQGEIKGWQHLAKTDLPADLELRDAAPVVVGSHVFLVGGETASGPTAGIARASLAPRPPFFQLGLFYAVVPALGIGGEVGQQLAYLNAAGAGTVGFVGLLLVGYAFNHRERTKAFLGRLRRRGHAG